MLEIICHLYDEEVEDFRTRTRQVLEHPDTPLPHINPTGWVKERHYIDLDFHKKLEDFLEEREKSIIWLENLENPDWSRAIVHEKFGPLTAKMFLTNWLAHEYLHIRQIVKLKYDQLKDVYNENLVYAGEWK